MSALGDAATEAGHELLRQAVRLLGDELSSILSRGSDFNYSDTAARVRGMLAEESESARAARKLKGE
jgi:hypothetical protein